MKKTLTLLFLLSAVLLIQAQDNKNWSLEVSYPFSVGDSFGSSNQGTIAAGIKYRFADLGKVRLGASLDVSWFATTFVNDTDPIQELKFTDAFWQPRIFAELPISQNNKLRLSGGIGWTIAYSKEGIGFFDEQGRARGNETNFGPNLNVGLTYDVSSRFFIHTQYDFIHLSRTNSLKRNIGLIKLGAGLRF